MSTLHLVSPIPPSVNHYLAYRAIIKNGKPMAMSYKTPEAVRYQKEFTEYVIAECERQGWNNIPDPKQHFYVDTVFYFPKTDLDCNNYFKCMLDAITEAGTVWADDNTVCERVMAIYYDSANPRIEITIHPVDYVGIFEDCAHLEAFRSRCIGCKRYTRNCSILRKAVEGRIQEEIYDGVCGRYAPVNQNEVKGEQHGKEQ